jgi:hypothetical protein
MSVNISENMCIKVSVNMSGNKSVKICVNTRKHTFYDSMVMPYSQSKLQTGGQFLEFQTKNKSAF